MYITYGKVYGGTPNIFMFWLFSENGSISQRTINRALIVHTTLWNSALTKKILIFIFTNYQNYPLALITALAVKDWVLASFTFNLLITPYISYFMSNVWSFGPHDDLFHPLLALFRWHKTYEHPRHQKAKPTHDRQTSTGGCRAIHMPSRKHWVFICHHSTKWVQYLSDTCSLYNKCLLQELSRLHYQYWGVNTYL